MIKYCKAADYNEITYQKRGNKASEYCFNKDFFISSQHAEHVSIQSTIENTMSTKVKKQNLKNLEKKHKSGKKRYTTTTFSSFLQVLVYPFQLLSCYPLFLYFSSLVQALSEHKPYHLYLFG